MSPTKLFVFAVSLSLAVSIRAAQLAPMPAPTPPSAAAAEKALTNDDVVTLAKAGFDDDLVISKIRQAPLTAFDVSTDALVRLKASGVSQRVIAEMMGAHVMPASDSGIRGARHGDISMSEPYVTFVGPGKHLLMARVEPTRLQTKADADNLASLAADAAVQDIAINAVAQGAAMTAGSMIPVIGPAVVLINHIPGFHREPKITLVYALETIHADTVFTAATPQFEAQFGSIPGVNPDDFEPALIRVGTTPKNVRIAYALKTTASSLHSEEPVKPSFIDERIALTETKVSRGHFLFEPKQPLPAGEYAVVLRPVSKETLISLSGTLGDGPVITPVWDFAIAAQ